MTFFMRCLDCLMFGCPTPDNLDMCGNCGSRNIEILIPYGAMAEALEDAEQRFGFRIEIDKNNVPRFHERH